MKDAPFRIKSAYSTGEVARLLGCSIQSVIKAVDEGRMPAWVFPGQRKRRIQHDDLVRWMEELGGLEFALKKLRGNG